MSLVVWLLWQKNVISYFSAHFVLSRRNQWPMWGKQGHISSMPQHQPCNQCRDSSVGRSFPVCELGLQLRAATHREAL